VHRAGRTRGPSSTRRFLHFLALLLGVCASPSFLRPASIPQNNQPICALLRAHLPVPIPIFLARAPQRRRSSIHAPCPRSSPAPHLPMNHLPQSASRPELGELGNPSATVLNPKHTQQGHSTAYTSRSRHHFQLVAYMKGQDNACLYRFRHIP
jgi:hypothetical protein